MKQLVKTIITESLNMLIMSSFLSSIGGIGIELVQKKVLVIMPLIIMIPAINHLMGNLATVLASKFTTYLYLGKVDESNYSNAKEIKELEKKVYLISIILSVYIAVVGYAIAALKGYPFSILIFIKILFVSVITSLLLLKFIFWITIEWGYTLYKKGKDPNNYLIPILTSVGDMGAMVCIAIMTYVLF
jgi:mgtE-like transporter